MILASFYNFQIYFLTSRGTRFYPILIYKSQYMIFRIFAKRCLSIVSHRSKYCIFLYFPRGKYSNKILINLLGSRGVIHAIITRMDIKWNISIFWPSMDTYMRFGEHINNRKSILPKRMMYLPEYSKTTICDNRLYLTDEILKWVIFFDMVGKIAIV